jgi:hypothetical protein
LFVTTFTLIPIAVEEQGFKPEYFKYYEEAEYELNLNSDVESMVLADPAKTHTKGSCNTAILGISVNVVTNKVYVREVVEGKFYPDELYEEMMNMADRINAIVLAPEVTGLNEYITQPLRNAISKAGKHFIIIEVKPRQGKTGPKRSGALISLYKQGHVYHNKDCCGSLEKYLLQWPRPARWDVIDALAGHVFVLEEGERYFLPKESAGDIEAEYVELDYEDELEYETLI